MFKKILVSAIAVSLVFVNALPAQAASKTIKIGTIATVTYPTTVKLKSSGCQTFPVKFKSTKNYIPIWLATVGLEDGNGNMAGGESFEGEEAKTTFTLNAKICRKAWDYSSDTRASGVKNGEYWLSFSVWNENLQTAQADVTIKLY